MDISTFTIHDLDSEIAVDHRCSTLLKQFHQSLLQEQIDPLEAGQLALGADYFVREFVVGECRENLFEINPVRVRQFAGHWYIIKTLEPNLKELTGILQGVAVFYAYLFQQGWLDEKNHQKIKTYTTNIDFYRQRIDTFWAISGEDGYDNWCQQCSLPQIQDV
jgi:hypothetical protein